MHIGFCYSFILSVLPYETSNISYFWCSKWWTKYVLTEEKLKVPAKSDFSSNLKRLFVIDVYEELKIFVDHDNE